MTLISAYAQKKRKSFERRRSKSYGREEEPRKKSGLKRFLGGKVKEEEGREIY